MQRWLKRWFWKWLGPWRVRYKDGAISIRMAYDSALGYAQIFGGVAVPDYEVDESEIRPVIPKT